MRGGEISMPQKILIKNELDNWKMMHCKQIQCKECVELNKGQEPHGCGGRYAID